MSIKVGLIGAGGMANYHIRGFENAGATVAAITSRTAASAKKLGERYAIHSQYTSVDEMIRRHTDLDAVSIITPNAFHKDYAITCLEAGLNVFCEKPPALNYAETIAMKSTAEKAKKLLMFNFNNRARPESLVMKEYIKSGSVGRINSAQAIWVRRTGIPGFGGWFTDRSMSGGGPVIDLLHMMDLALSFMGFPEPEWILARTFTDFTDDKSFKGPWGIRDNDDGITDVETASHAFVTFKTGQVLFIRSSWAEMNKKEQCYVTFQGERAGGKVERLYHIDGIDESSRDFCELYTHENGLPVNREIIFDRDRTMGRVKNAENFIQAIAGKEEPLSTPDQACVLMKIVDALYESAKTGAPVRFTT